MKFLSKVISLSLIVLLGATMLVGCSTHKYELVGVVLNSSDTTITLLDELPEDIKNDIVYRYGDSCYIDLNQNGSFTMKYSIDADNGHTITFEQVGTYELNQKENQIVFYTPTSTGDMQPTTQQYLNGKIIYYDGYYFLAFK